jgi:hypothetical protein
LDGTVLGLLGGGTLCRYVRNACMPAEQNNAQPSHETFMKRVQCFKRHVGDYALYWYFGHANKQQIDIVREVKKENEACMVMLSSHRAIRTHDQPSLFLLHTFPVLTPFTPLSSFDQGNSCSAGLLAFASACAYLSVVGNSLASPPCPFISTGSFANRECAPACGGGS